MDFDVIIKQLTFLISYISLWDQDFYFLNDSEYPKHLYVLDII